MQNDVIILKYILNNYSHLIGHTLIIVHAKEGSTEKLYRINYEQQSNFYHSGRALKSAQHYSTVLASVYFIDLSSYSYGTEGHSFGSCSTSVPWCYLYLSQLSGKPLQSIALCLRDLSSHLRRQQR